MAEERLRLTQEDAQGNYENSQWAALSDEALVGSSMTTASHVTAPVENRRVLIALREFNAAADAWRTRLENLTHALIGLSILVVLLTLALVVLTAILAFR